VAVAGAMAFKFVKSRAPHPAEFARSDVCKSISGCCPCGSRLGRQAVWRYDSIFSPEERRSDAASKGRPLRKGSGQSQRQAVRRLRSMARRPRAARSGGRGDKVVRVAANQGHVPVAAFDRTSRVIGGPAASRTGHMERDRGYYEASSKTVGRSR
jgi:hypothetical protein